MPEHKVFGIGFQKTGTSSLAGAFYTLGYNVTGFFGTHDPDIGDRVHDLAFDLADRFDAAQDMPWPVLYQELDRRYPGSKFVLTVRPTEPWIRSMAGHFKSQDIPLHAWVYGVGAVRGNEEVFVRRYEEHNREVIEYFRDRPDDLLVLDLARGDGWGPLCSFLGHKVPPVPFPVANTSRGKSREIVKRGVKFMRKKLNKYNRRHPASNMPRGVSAAFVRDILHYHQSLFDDALAAVEQLSDAQFEETGRSGRYSVRDLLVEQLAEEQLWLQRLRGTAGAAPPATPASLGTKESLSRAWDDHKVLMRALGASQTAESLDSRVRGRQEYVWEVFVHLTNAGTERRTLLVQLLTELGAEIEPRSFMSFFRGENGKPAAAKPSIANAG